MVVGGGGGGGCTGQTPIQALLCKSLSILYNIRSKVTLDQHHINNVSEALCLLRLTLLLDLSLSDDLHICHIYLSQ